MEERTATWPRKWMAEGYRKGRAKGRAKGHAEGRQSALRLALSVQVEERFGTLEPRYERMIAEASEAELKNWLKYILSATTLDDLFED